MILKNEDDTLSHTHTQSQREREREIRGAPVTVEAPSDWWIGEEPMGIRHLCEAAATKRRIRFPKALNED